MTAETNDNVDVISALMIERERYTGWLHELEERKAGTSPHVFERVKSDYESRLRAVLEKLASRAADVEASIAEHSAKLAELRAEEQRNRDERDEAELRAAVGEYTSEQWDGIRQKADEAIGKLRGEQETLSTELARLQHVLSVARPAQPETPAPQPEPTVAQDNGAHDDATVQPVSEPVREQAEQPVAAAPVAQSATPHTTTRPKSGAHPAADQPARSPRGHTPRHTPRGATPARGFDELAFLNAVMDAPAPTVERTAPRTQAAKPSTRRPTDPLIDRSHEAALDLTAREGIGSLASKTLRCGECGTMNLPTEWYCERCGGELSAL